MAQLTVDDVAAFREPVRRLAADRFSRKAVRETGNPERLDREAWAALCELGVFGVLTPEDDGGLDLGMSAAVPLWEECGSGLVPGPLVWTVLAASHVDGATTGDVLVAGTDRGPGPLIVDHAADADYLVVIDREVRLYRRDELMVRALTPLDPLTPVAQVELVGDGEPIATAEPAIWRRSGTILSAAYLVGAARLALDAARRHALDRSQFGRPIAGFQAIKHVLADMAAHIELAAVAVADAATKLDGDHPDAARAAHVAKVTAADAARLAAKHCIQIHGGMGYTWEADPHLIWKRVMVWERVFGSGGSHAARLADFLERSDG